MRRICRANRLRGERLTAGISLSNEMDEQLSQLRIIDPDVEEPLIELGEKEGALPTSACASLPTAPPTQRRTPAWLKPAVLDLQRPGLCETRTVRWREMDSNHQYPEEKLASTVALLWHPQANVVLGVRN